MSYYGNLVSEGFLDKFKPNKEAKEMIKWNERAVKLKQSIEKIISKYKDNEIIKYIDFKELNELIKIHDNKLDSLKSSLGKYFNQYYSQYIESYYKYFKDINNKYNKSSKNNTKVKRSNYTVDVSTISFNKAREILCKDIKKACSNCNKNPAVKKELLKGLEKLRNKYPGIENESDYKVIEKAINNNNLFKFEDGGDYFYVCGVATQEFILSCYPQYMVGEELEKISSFQIDDIHYGDGDEGCLYISPYTD